MCTEKMQELKKCKQWFMWSFDLFWYHKDHFSLDQISNLRLRRAMIPDSVIYADFSLRGPAKVWLVRVSRQEQILLSGQGLKFGVFCKYLCKSFKKFENYWDSFRKKQMFLLDISFLASDLGKLGSYDNIEAIMKEKI